MRLVTVTVPHPTPPGARLPHPELGRLGVALHRLAGMQGSWPVRPPQHAVTVELPAGLDPADAVQRGAADGDALADRGVDLLVAGCPGPVAPALVVIAALLDLEPVAAVGTRAFPGWAELITAVRDGLAGIRDTLDSLAVDRHVGVLDPRRDPAALLGAVADPAVGYLTGLLGRAAERRTPVVVDATPSVLAAGLLADRLGPGARDWLLAGCTGSLPAGRLALRRLELEPLLDLQLDVPGGAQLAYDVLRAGVELAEP